MWTQKKQTCLAAKVGDVNVLVSFTMNNGAIIGSRKSSHHLNGMDHDTFEPVCCVKLEDKVVPDFLTLRLGGQSQSRPNYYSEEAFKTE